ncbi:AP2 domain containing protein [Musa troglodytarum]|uniref:AP2 domain containing protein n=1 Tax=Musa troglodytarum TaxID=320322 RepID=A0A9E7HT14_9LILI|nr:AP2 domain containing protein [Musa troglodytarum]
MEKLVLVISPILRTTGLSTKILKDTAKETHTAYVSHPFNAFTSETKPNRDRSRRRRRIRRKVVDAGRASLSATFSRSLPRSRHRVVISSGLDAVDGINRSFPVVLPKLIENGNAVDNSNQHVKPVSVHPMPSTESSIQKPVKESIYPGSSSAFGSRTSKEEPNNNFLGKRRKRHRRKHYEDQEPCIMTGVYFKNMKWQAAIKVDKKQIHLGTVGSQEEAARLYDRAAFMCGREPNFELSEEEKQELRPYNWDEFLEKTRSAINDKKHQRKLTVGRRKKSETHTPNSNWEHEGGTPVSSMSDDDEDVDANTCVL